MLFERGVPARRDRPFDVALRTRPRRRADAHEQMTGSEIDCRLLAGRAGDGEDNATAALRCGPQQRELHLRERRMWQRWGACLGEWHAQVLLAGARARAAGPLERESQERGRERYRRRSSRFASSAWTLPMRASRRASSSFASWATTSKRPAGPPPARAFARAASTGS